MTTRPPEPPCGCPGPGFCERYQIRQGDRAWRLCRGEACSPEASDRYRETWAARRDAGPARAALRVVARPPAAPPPRKARPRRPPRPAGGPGTELKLLLASLGLYARAGCGCDKLAAWMDHAGVGGCRRHEAEILDRLREQAARRGWWEKAKAAALALASGLAFKLDPLDPAPGLLAEALRRAEAKAANPEGGVS